jgi:hypothetical protein
MPLRDTTSGTCCCTNAIECVAQAACRAKHSWRCLGGNKERNVYTSSSAVNFADNLHAGRLPCSCKAPAPYLHCSCTCVASALLTHYVPALLVSTAGHLPCSCTAPALRLQQHRRCTCVASALHTHSVPALLVSKRESCIGPQYTASAAQHDALQHRLRGWLPWLCRTAAKHHGQQAGVTASAGGGDSQLQAAAAPAKLVVSDVAAQVLRVRQATCRRVCCHACRSVR